MGILFAGGAGGVVGFGATFSRGGGASSAAKRSARARKVIAAARNRQPNVRIMVDRLVVARLAGGRQIKAYRPGDDGERVCGRISGSAHIRDAQTSADFPR